ncbi:MAG: zinc-ribbon domain-containing protein, partial [Acidobacteriota bacterium]|nr:zinc-ribbon domain-containing protein [Acidobacteriota bacterium]
SCSTHYRLRPERLTPAIRRARCYTCQHVFPIGDVVQRLLAPAAPLAEEPPTLTLTDLDGAEAEILDKTLVETPEGLPEAKPATEDTADSGDATLSGYTSARDAIEKLLGETTAPAAREARAFRPSSSPMDVEATLSALEQTLGGTPIPAPAPPSTSTVRFTREEVMAAMAAPGPEAPAAAEPTVALPISEVPSPAPDPLEAAASARTLMTGPLAIPAAASPDMELLRLKTGEEVYPGLTMAQIIQWVEEGRVLEGHLVARQFSENWLEAYKVPGLRPVFDRLRRERAATQPASMEMPPPLETTPVKRGLFSGLFGGKN